MKRTVKRMFAVTKDFIGADNIEVFSHAKNYLSAGMIINALGLASIPIITRLVSVEEYGIISIFNSITTIFTILLGLNLNFYVDRYYHERTRDFNQLIGISLLFLIYFNLALFPLLYAFRSYFALFFQVQSRVFVFAAVVSFIYVIKNLVLVYFKTTLQSVKHAVLTVVETFLILALSIILMYLMEDEKYMGRIYGEFFISLAMSVYYFYRISRVASFRWSRKLLKQSLLFSLPLVPYSLSNYVLNQYDRIIINQLKGAAATGIYSFAYKVGSIMLIITTNLNKAWGPLFYSKMKDRDYTTINSVLKKNTTMLYFFGIGLMLLSNECVVILADKKFHAALPIVPIIVMAYVLLYIANMFGQYSTYLHRTGSIAVNTFVAGAINIALNYIFIPQYGYFAAAWSTLISYVILCALHYYTIRKLVKFKNIIPLKHILPDMIYLLAAFGLFYIVESAVKNYAISLMIRMLFIIIVFYLLWGRRFIKLFMRRDQS